MSFRERFAAWRTAQRLSVADIATRCGIPLGTLKKYESGDREPGYEVLGKLAKAGIDIHWLVTGGYAGPSPEQLALEAQARRMRDVTIAVAQAAGEFSRMPRSWCEDLQHEAFTNNWEVARILGAARERMANRLSRPEIYEPLLARLASTIDRLAKSTPEIKELSFEQRVVLAFIAYDAAVQFFPALDRAREATEQHMVMFVTTAAGTDGERLKHRQYDDSRG